MPSSVPSNSVLSQLYSNLCSSGVQSKVVAYLNEPNLIAYYNPIISSLRNWVNATSTKESIGLSATDTISGLRIVVVLPDGHVVYDSGQEDSVDGNGNGNVYTHINKPANNFITSGKYKINENHNTRLHVITANLSQSGISFATKFSTSTDAQQYYIAVRQGSQYEHTGTIIISMDDIPNVTS